MMGQIRKHLHRWAQAKLSLAGRIMVSNQVILSSIWYLASCTDLSGKALKLARTTVRNYMWSGKEISKARAQVKWATAVLPIVRGRVKILDPQWQASVLLVKLLIRGLSVGYEPWKVLVRYRVSHTRQSRSGRWPTNANWIMNTQQLVKQGSTMWQGVMRAWNTIQSGIEQQAPVSWDEIMRQPLFGNRLLTCEQGIQWGTDNRNSMRWWADKGIQAIKDIFKPEGSWKSYSELGRLKKTRAAPPLYARLVNSIPWEATPAPDYTNGQWLACKEEDGQIRFIYHLKQANPQEANLYRKETSEQLTLLGTKQRVHPGAREVRVVRTMGPRNVVLDYNPIDDPEPDDSIWHWGGSWIGELQWDPKDWQWRRIGVLPDTSILNYSTKRGYRVALRQDHNQMPIDAELEAAGYDSKFRAKFFNRLWHPYLPRKVSAMQWLILSEGLPVGAWREKLGLSGACQLCAHHERETLAHSFLECQEVTQSWTYFRATRNRAGLPTEYTTWAEISRGLLKIPRGPSVEADLQWDTASAFTINSKTPWDILRAQLLWAIWCQRVAHAFKDENFHLGLVLWHAWRNTIYCAMEAFKELHRHKRNEEKRQEQIACFQQIWTIGNIFGRLTDSGIKWNFIPPQEFLPKELAAWMIPPIRINRLSPSPDLEADFMAQTDFADRVQDFLNEIGNRWRPQGEGEPLPDLARPPERHRPSSPATASEQNSLHHPTEGQSTTENLPPHSITHTSEGVRPGSGDPEDTSTSMPIRAPLAHIHLNHTETRARPRSRKKSKCCFRTRRNTHLTQQGKRDEQSASQTEGRIDDAETDEIDALLLEIDRTRREEVLLPPHSDPQGQTLHVDPPPTTKNRPSAHLDTPDNSRPHSRVKIKCPFGPLSRPRGEEHEAPPPTTGSHSAPLEPQGPTSPQATEGTLNPPLEIPTDPETSGPHPPLEKRISFQVDRVTLEPPRHRGGTPFDHYKAQVPEAPQPNPYRFLLPKLNLTEEELNSRVDREVDTLLRDLRNERQLARLSTGDDSLQRILTKEDCLTLFRATGVPQSGSLWGVYRWAADLGIARFNFDMELTPENIALLDAYD